MGSSKDSLRSKWIICSAWPYVHAIPHLGNLIGSALSADVFARFKRLQGLDVVFVSGSDEHGARMEYEAWKQGVTPKELVNSNHKKIKKLFEEFGISYDNYSRTSGENHRKFIQEFYKKVYRRGYVKKGVETLPFCENCRRFLADRLVTGTCPYCGYEKAKGNQCDDCGKILKPSLLVNPKCAFCGSKPVFKQSKHWYLDLPALKEKLEKYVDEMKHWSPMVTIVTKEWLRELRRRDITRDLKWGVPAPFPGSEEKTIYCWFEAVLGYISATIEWAEENGRDWRSYWFNHETKSIYFLGKDNIVFHSVILPALLIASGEPYVLPYQIAATEFLNFEGKKFSKTEGVGIWMDEAIKILPADYWRFYLIRIRPEKRDTDFILEDFADKANNELVGKIGNFINRVLTFIYKYFNSKVPEPGKQGEQEASVKRALKDHFKELTSKLEEAKLKKAVKTLIELVDEFNRYLQVSEPWKTFEKDRDKCSATLYTGVNLCRSLAILMEPFMPFTAEKLWSQLLNLKGSVHSENWFSALESKVEPGHVIGKPKLLFRKVDIKELQRKMVSKPKH